MTKEEKLIYKLKRIELRRDKNIQRMVRRIEERKADLVNCPFDVEMNGLYGTCTCDGVDRQKCAQEI